MLKKLLSTILLTIMLVSFAEPIFAFSSSGTGKWVAGQYNSGIKTTDSKGIIIRRLTNYTTNEKITVFCTEFGVDLQTGAIETAQHIVPTDPLMKTACKIAYFGWYSRYGEYAVDGGILTEGFRQVKLDYVFTQQMIWEVLNQSNATFLDSDIQNQYILFKNQISSDIQNKQKKPSFCDETIILDAGQTITLTDANGVLTDYTTIDKTIDGIRIMHNKGENTLTITVNNDCTLENYTISEEMMKNWGVIKESTKDNDTTVFFSFKEGVQDQLYAMHYNDPVTMSMNLKINVFGKLELNKLDKDGKLIDGAVFEINGPDNFYKEVDVTNGKILIENLKKGEYRIKEKLAPKGYLLDNNTYIIQVEPNKTVTQSILNEKPTGTLIVDKTIALRKDVDASLIDINDISGIQFKLTAKENVIGFTDGSVIYNLNKSGDLKIENLPMGTYELQEVKTLDGLILDKTKYEVKFTQKDQVTKVYIETKKIQNETSLTEIAKIDMKGEKLAGAKLTILDEQGKTVHSWISSEELYKIEGLAIGQKYILREEIAPEGYTIAQDIEFIAKESQLIEMKDSQILKTIKIIKQDYEAKDIIKSKFKFGIYEDSECSRLIKEVESDRESGTVTFEALTYGTYYIKELEAPSGYLLSDKIIKIEINSLGTFADEELLEDNNSVCTFIYYNQKIQMIQTGVDRNYPLLISSLLISMSGLLYLVLKNKFSIS